MYERGLYKFMVSFWQQVIHLCLGCQRFVKVTIIFLIYKEKKVSFLHIFINIFMII